MIYNKHVEGSHMLQQGKTKICFFCRNSYSMNIEQHILYNMKLRHPHRKTLLKCV